MIQNITHKTHSLKVLKNSYVARVGPKIPGGTVSKGILLARYAIKFIEFVELQRNEPRKILQDYKINSFIRTNIYKYKLICQIIIKYQIGNLK
jgi:hypothetical protein